LFYAQLRREVIMLVAADFIFGLTHPKQRPTIEDLYQLLEHPITVVLPTMAQSTMVTHLRPSSPSLNQRQNAVNLSASIKYAPDSADDKPPL
jgi:hypothetical protein